MTRADRRQQEERNLSTIKLAFATVCDDPAFIAWVHQAVDDCTKLHHWYRLFIQLYVTYHCSFDRCVVTADEDYPVEIVGSADVRGLGDATFNAWVAKRLGAEGTQSRSGAGLRGRPPVELPHVEQFYQQFIRPLLDSAQEHLPRPNVAHELGPAVLHEQASARAAGFCLCAHSACAHFAARERAPAARLQYKARPAHPNPRR
jgi:hypothetical protein